jgi:hypothetical protein
MSERASGRVRFFWGTAMNRAKTRPNAADVVQALRGGATLLRSFERPRTKWLLSDGREVGAEAAEQAILHPDVASGGDGLFPHLAAQTYRAAK